MEELDKIFLELPFRLYRLAIAVRSEITRRLTDAYGEEFTADYWYLLVEIRDNGQLTLSQLARITGRDKASLSRTLGGMERLGVIVRLPNPGHKRSELIAPVGSALEFVEQASGIVSTIMRSALQELRPIEVKELDRMLEAAMRQFTD